MKLGMLLMRTAVLLATNPTGVCNTPPLSQPTINSAPFTSNKPSAPILCQYRSVRCDCRSVMTLCTSILALQAASSQPSTCSTPVRLASTPPCRHTMAALAIIPTPPAITHASSNGRRSGADASGVPVWPRCFAVVLAMDCLGMGWFSSVRR